MDHMTQVQTCSTRAFSLLLQLVFLSLDPVWDLRPKMYLWYFRQAGPVQHRASLNRGLCKQWQGQTSTLGVLFPTLCKKCMSSLMSSANHFRKEAGDSYYHLSSLSQETRMSNHSLMSKQRHSTSSVILRVLVQSGAWTLTLPYHSSTLQHKLTKRCSKRS